MTHLDQSNIVWIVTDEGRGPGDRCVVGVYRRASGAYAKAADISVGHHDPRQVLVMAHEVTRDGITWPS